MRQTLRWLTGAIVVIGLVSPAFARDYIKITDPNFRPYPLAVPEVRDMGGAAKDQLIESTEVIRFDMDVVGLFKLLDPRSFIANPKQEGMTGGSINFADWANVGAEGLVKIGLSKSGSSLTLEGHLFDVTTGKELLSKKYQGNETGVRRMTHMFADAIIRHFTGNGSVFFTQIAFAKRTQRKSKEICVMDFDGHNERCVVQDGSLNLLPAWTADGAGVYYSTYLHGGPHLYVYDLKSGKSKPISRYSGLNIGAAASPDGRLLALTLSKDGNSEIYALSANGGNPKRLTHQEWAIDSSPSWSPDSKRIAFVSERSGNPQIYVMNADGSGERRLTFQGNYNQTPNWSPSGDFILFNARDERLVYDIFKISPANGEVVRLTQDQGNNEHPTFSPDGNLVVFSSTRGGESKLYVMNANGTQQRLISRGSGEYTTPEWGPFLKNPEK